MCHSQTVDKLVKSKNDIVFIGGISEVFYGFRNETKDIDIKVLNLNGLELIKDLQTFTSNGIMSKSKKRAYGYLDGILIDIFIEDELPDYIEHNGIKYCSIEDMKQHYLFMKENSIRENEIKRYCDKLKKL